MGRVGLLNRMKILYLFAPHNDEAAIVVQHGLHLLEEHNGVLKAEQVNVQSKTGIHFLWLSKGHCFHLLGDASQKDELIAPLRDVHLKRKVLIVEAIAANAHKRAQLIVSKQVIEPAFQRWPSFALYVPLQFAEEVNEVELEEGIKEGEVLRVYYLDRLFEEVRELLPGLQVFLRHMRAVYQLPQVLKGQSFVPLQKTGHILSLFCLNAALDHLQLLKLNKDRVVHEFGLDAIKLLPCSVHACPLHKLINNRYKRGDI